MRVFHKTIVVVVYAFSVVSAFSNTKPVDAIIASYRETDRAAKANLLRLSIGQSTTNNIYLQLRLAEITPDRDEAVRVLNDLLNESPHDAGIQYQLALISPQSFSTIERWAKLESTNALPYYLLAARCLGDDFKKQLSYVRQGNSREMVLYHPVYLRYEKSFPERFDTNIINRAHTESMMQSTHGITSGFRQLIYTAEKHIKDSAEEYAWETLQEFLSFGENLAAARPVDIFSFHCGFAIAHDQFQAYLSRKDVPLNRKQYATDYQNFLNGIFEEYRNRRKKLVAAMPADSLITNESAAMIEEMISLWRKAADDLKPPRGQEKSSGASGEVRSRFSP